ncbi:MAG TPA: RNA 2',3'-cyclic phosphodiesterase [Steroidobacteraceae bacterium]
MRLFFALWPDTDVTAQLASAASKLTMHAPGRLVNPKNYHLTLAFIGEVANSRLAVLQQAGRSLRAPGYDICLDSMEYWPASQAVVAAAQEVPSGLMGLWAQLHDALAMPRTQFRAHVTLARNVTQAPVLQAMSPIFWRATSFGLVRSETGGAESAYTVVTTWPLLYET